MTVVYCPDCEANQDQLGSPSHARWQGPDGLPYCSIHFTRRFGLAEKLVKIPDYEPPKTTRKPRAKAEA